ncbi:hypothetical protein PRIPAC_81264 [Pristionchus pacificus]|uniref:Paired domain-containing protein n=1 Tax=Pristionchus pacificus TaxID=54126 RepID=A0A2A6CLT8_PRIPA|nr:hypothetical protein PRIPAC_81264 [Pristionchus pacificus]|eukprot:PDM79058.1 hypothetical protein PRIPAC_31637 [Pristionchus pacificus]
MLHHSRSTGLEMNGSPTITGNMHDGNDDDALHVQTTNTGINVKGGTYAPGRPLPMKMRQQIIEYHGSGMKVGAISERLRISHSCVCKILAR